MPENPCSRGSYKSMRSGWHDVYRGSGKRRWRHESIVMKERNTFDEIPMKCTSNTFTFSLTIVDRLSILDLSTHLKSMPMIYHCGSWRKTVRALDFCSKKDQKLPSSHPPSCLNSQKSLSLSFNLDKSRNRHDDLMTLLTTEQTKSKELQEPIKKDWFTYLPKK